MRVAAVTMLLLALTGCSKDPTQPESGWHSIGPITPANAVAPNGQMLWPVTNDLIAADAMGTSLVAINAASGATRVLDTLASIPVALSPDGAAVYYNAFTDDASDVLAFRRALTGSHALDTLGQCSSLCVHFIVPAPDGDHVAIMALGDSVRVLRLSSPGEALAVSEDLPLAFSANSAQLLVNPLDPPLTDARIITLGTSGDQPAGLGVPDTTSGYKVRWGAAGIEVLFVAADHRHLLLRRATAGLTDLIWTSPDSLEAPLAWSAGGELAALWSSRTLSPLERLWELHVIRPATRTVWTIASMRASASVAPQTRSAGRFGTQADIFPPLSPRGVAFSPDGRQVAYAFLDGRVYISRLSGPAE